MIFRHPVRVDPNTGKPGESPPGARNVRRGRGHDLKDQLNQLLAEESFWSLPARAEVEKRFHRRVVEIFYHGMEPEQSDFGAIRESIIPPPTSKDSDYRRALLLGTTGAGKTTLLRQLIGTDPETERFPSTSTAKTTVHETEVVLAPGPYKAVVTFFPIDEVREHLNDASPRRCCPPYRGDGDGEVLRKLLMQQNQRFRFNYVLAAGLRRPAPTTMRMTRTTQRSRPRRRLLMVIDLDATNALLTKTLTALRAPSPPATATNSRPNWAPPTKRISGGSSTSCSKELIAGCVKTTSSTASVTSSMDEIELRFSLLTDGTVRRNKQGWPQSWSWETDDRATFIKTVTRFSSNHSPRWAPVDAAVEQVRVSGAFCRRGTAASKPKLVLLDGEGLGPHAKSVAAISTSLTRRIESTDAIVLVDNAVQPMQAAPVAAIAMITSGASKLLLVFTHFDEVKGDNLPTRQAGEQHVLASAENVLASIGEELGPFAERALRGRLKEACFFVGESTKTWTPRRKRNKRTIGQLQALLRHRRHRRRAACIGQTGVRPHGLVLAVKNAAEVSTMHGGCVWVSPTSPAWARDTGSALGIEPAPQHTRPGDGTITSRSDPRSNWDRYVLLQNPLRWIPQSRPTTHTNSSFDGLANALSAKTLDRQFAAFGPNGCRNGKSVHRGADELRIALQLLVDL